MENLEDNDTFEIFIQPGEVIVENLEDMDPLDIIAVKVAESKLSLLNFARTSSVKLE